MLNECLSIDTAFNPPYFSSDCTFKLTFSAEYTFPAFSDLLINLDLIYYRLIDDSCCIYTLVIFTPSIWICIMPLFE